MRDEAIRARDEAFMALDKAHRLRDEAEGLNAEAAISKADACGMRHEAAAFLDDVERIYADVVVVKDDYERVRGGYPFECVEARSLWTDRAIGVTRIICTRKGTPLLWRKWQRPLTLLLCALNIPKAEWLHFAMASSSATTVGVVGNDGNDVGDDGVADLDEGDGVGEEGEGGVETPIGGHEDGDDGGVTAGEMKPGDAGQADAMLSYARLIDATQTDVGPSHAGLQMEGRQMSLTLEWWWQMRC